LAAVPQRRMNWCCQFRKNWKEGRSFFRLSRRTVRARNRAAAITPCR